MNVIQMSLPLMPSNVNSMYKDQSINGVSVYTPHGIKELDSMFCTRIRNLIENKEKIRLLIENDENYLRIFFKHEKLKWLNDTPEIIENEIINNEHLHPCIKENLLENLNNYRKLL